MVDLSKAQKGDKVKFRCGGEAVIDGHYPNDCDIFTLDIMGNLFDFYDNGGFYKKKQTPFDIISIEPAPFDWSTVKNGMGFEDIVAGAIFIYIGPSMINEETLVVQDITAAKCIRYIDRRGLFRAPEHDIEVG